MKFENDAEQLNALLGPGNHITRLTVINGRMLNGDQTPKVELDLLPEPRFDKPFVKQLLKIVCDGVTDLKLEPGMLDYTELPVADVRDRQLDGLNFQFGTGSHDSNVSFLCKSFTVNVAALD